MRPYVGIIFVYALLLCCASCANEYRVIDKNSEEIAAFHQQKPYILGYGDSLVVTVWGHEELNSQPVVRPDGKISLPLIGDIQAEGLSIDDLKQELDKRFSEYVQEPETSVTLREIASLKIYIIGEVARPGEYDLDSYTDILQAIAKAGGFTDYARKNRIQLIRKQGNEKIKFRFNYSQVVKGKDLDQNIPLKPGDVIIVP